LKKSDLFILWALMQILFAFPQPAASEIAQNPATLGLEASLPTDFVRRLQRLSPSLTPSSVGPAALRPQSEILKFFFLFFIFFFYLCL